MTANALRWDGRPGHFEVWYLVVAGLLWLRYTIRVPSDPDAEGEAELWLASFAGPPSARKATFPLDALRVPAQGWPLELGPGRLGNDEASGEIDSARWDLRLEGAAQPFWHAPAVARALRVSPTQVVLTKPSLAVTGRVEVDGGRHELVAAPACQAHLWGSRHADRWGWLHATLPDGRWVEAVTVKLRGLPPLAFHATERGRGGPLDLVRTPADLAPGHLRLGPYRVEASRDDFVGVTYRDPDGAEVYCYHTERARLDGPGVAAEDVAFEYGSREKLRGWPLSL
ncbi:MAG TPA: hypothetical protein VGF23_14750 [Gaiellaceae bacterium]